MMKKLLLALLLITSIHASPYIAVGGSLSNADETLVECRISGVAIAGIQLNEMASVEARYSLGLNGDYQSYGAYIKPQYKGFYGLVGAGKTIFKKGEDYSGARVGAGYEFETNTELLIFSDIIYRESEGDTVLTVGVKYEF